MKQYEQMSVRSLRHYATAFGIHQVDVAHYLGKRVSVFTLKKSELVALHLALDAAGCGLASLEQTNG